MVPCLSGSSRRQFLKSTCAAFALAHFDPSIAFAPPDQPLISAHEIARIDHERILRAANGYLSQPPVTITASTSPRSAGGKHDYFSEGDYWWPDPNNPGDEHALYEDYYFEAEQVTQKDSAPADSVYEQWPIGSTVNLHLSDVPSTMTVGQRYVARVAIANGSSRTLLPQSEFIRWGTLELATRWFARQEGADTRDEFAKTPFPGRIEPGRILPALANVKAPDTPGEYWLQADIREAGSWFSQLPDHGSHERQLVRVVPLVWPTSRRTRTPS